MSDAKPSSGLTTPKKITGNSCNFKYFDAKTKPNSVLSTSNYQSRKSYNSSINNTSLKSPTTQFGNRTKEQQTYMQTQSDIKVTNPSPSTSKKVTIDFKPKFKENSASIRKTIELQTSGGEVTKPIKNLILTSAQNTMRGIIRKEFITDNSNPNACSLTPSQRKLSEIYSGVSIIRRQNEERKLTSPLQTPKRVTTPKLSMNLESPLQKKNDNLKSCLFGLDKRITSYSTTNSACNSRKNSRDNFKAINLEEDDFTIGRFTAFSPKFDFTKSNTEILFKKKSSNSCFGENSIEKNPKERKMELLSSRYDKIKYFEKPDDINRLNSLKKTKEETFISKKNFQLYETHDTISELTMKLYQNKREMEAAKSNNYVIPNYTKMDTEKAKDYVENVRLSKKFQKMKTVSIPDEAVPLGKKQFVAKKAITRPIEYKSPQKKHFRPENAIIF